jgi:hypothetical protein
MIISGGLNEKIWGQEIIIKDFESFKERKIKLTIIVGEKFNPKANSKLHLFLKKNVGSDFLRLYIYPDSNGPINHLIIVDNAHLRLEQKHTEEDSKRSAEIRYYAGSLAGRAKVKFEEYRIKSRLLLKEDFKELVEA